MNTMWKKRVNVSTRSFHEDAKSPLPPTPDTGTSYRFNPRRRVTPSPIMSRVKNIAARSVTRAQAQRICVRRPTTNPRIAEVRAAKTRMISGRKTAIDATHATPRARAAHWIVMSRRRNGRIPKMANSAHRTASGTVS